VPLEVGSVAPNVELPGDTGQFYRLSDYQGKKVVLYFYPKDNTSGCTTEACDFRDRLRDFNLMNAIILGISRDKPSTHDKFKEKYALTFPLLSDEDGTVCNLYETWVEKSLYGKKYFGIERSTFLIDEEGIIRQIWRKVKVDGHAREVFKALQEI
jgi:peroxiredoxin Q/BCP